MSAIRRIGILLAAGRGSRMGGSKQLHAIETDDGPLPLVCAAYDAIRPICHDVIVVLGHDAEAVAAALEDRTFYRAVSAPDGPMFDSIRSGLLAAQALDASAGIVLHPADHPAVSLLTLSMLRDCSLQRSDQAIIPEYQSRGGHPILIPPGVATAILAENCPDGLAQFWRDHPDLCVRIAVNDATILRDIDTPDDLSQ